MKKLTIAIGLLVTGSAPALANECPTLHQQVMAEVQRRFDNAAWEAKQLAAAGEKLHADGKHSESVAKYDEAAKAAGITLSHKK